MSYENARDSYLSKYAGEVDGRSSMRFIEAVEELVMSDNLSKQQ
jgi:hypothetical protein